MLCSLYHYYHSNVDIALCLPHPHSLQLPGIRMPYATCLLPLESWHNCVSQLQCMQVYAGLPTTGSAPPPAK